MKASSTTRLVNLLRGILCIAAAGALYACGGGGGGGVGAGGAVTSQGAIQGFGSIIVNGVEYQTVGATLHLRDTKQDKVLQTEAEIRGFLQEGMVVTVKGTVDDNGTSGRATEIEFRHQMEAQIDDKGTDFIVAMGQTIVLDDSIKAGIDSLAVGDRVRISGLPDDKGGLRATSIIEDNSITEFEAKGIVSAPFGNSFTLLLSPGATSGLSVTLAAGQTLPADGAFVEVKSASVVGSDITNATVEVEDRLTPGQNEKMEFEGFVSSGTVSDFFVNGQEVTTSASTIFVGGLASDFAIGSKVEVEGRFVGGVLVASKVQYKENLRIDAAVEAINGNEVTLLGKKVIVGSGTILKGSGGASIGLADLAVGQELLVRGILAANGNDISAARIDIKGASVDSANFRPILRGVASAKDAAAGTLTIAGFAISTAGGTEFRGLSDAVLTKAAFFDAVIINTTMIKVDWSAPFSSSLAAVRRAELEK